MAYTPNNPNGSALSASSAPVVIASDQLAISTKDTIVAAIIPTATVMQNAAVAIGVGVNLNVQGYSSAIISISGTMTGSTIVFKESPDDVTFNPIAAHQIGITGNLSTTATTVGEFRISCAGLKSLQAVITVYGSGSITVKGFASPLAGHTTTVNSNIIASLPAGTATIGSVKLPDVATAGTLAALNATVATPVNSQGAVGIQLTGTWVGTVQFQGTEDPLNISAPTTSWFPVNGVASVSGVQSTTTTTNGQYRVNAGAYVAVRAIMTVFTSGSATVWMNATVAASMATLAEPLPTGTNTIGGVLITDNTNTANVLKADGTAAGQNSQLTAGAYLSVPFTTTTVVAVGVTDAGNYKSVSLQINLQGTGSVITFQGSDDNVNWINVGLNNATPSAASTNLTSTAGSGFILANSLGYRYFRLSVTGITAGTTSGVIVFSTMPYVPQFTYVAQSTATPWAVGSNSATGSAMPANAFPVGINNNGNLNTWSAMSNLTADGILGSTTAAIGSVLFNGTTYDRARGDLTNGAFVQVKAIAAGTNTIGALTANQSVNTAQVNGVAIDIGGGSRGLGTQRVTLATDQITNTNPLLVKQQVQITGGATPFQLISAATTNATSIKVTNGTVYGVQVYNNTATVAFLKMYNKITAPTVGTDVPVKIIQIPANGGSNLSINDLGIAFSVGIAFAITGLPTVADVTAVTLSGIIVNIDYV